MSSESTPLNESRLWEEVRRLFEEKQRKYDLILEECTPPQELDGEQKALFARYEHLTPHQLNLELKGLYQQLPRRIETAEEIFPPPNSSQERIQERIQERRTNSEHYKILHQKLGVLLLFSPTTISFQQSFMLDFRYVYCTGVPKEKVEGWLFGLLLDEDYPNSGGIFDPSRSRELEQRAYRRCIEAGLSARGILGMVKESLGMVGEGDNGETDSARGAKLKLVTPNDVIRKKWRGEYIERYGDEP